MKKSWIVVTALTMLVACSLAGAGDNKPLLTSKEASEVDRVIASVVAAGFPDGRNAKVYSGALHVSATYDPAKALPPLPTSASNTQMTIPNSTKVTYGYNFNGLHFKLPDGSWIISMMYRFKASEGDTVGLADAREINLTTLTADAIAAHPFDAEKNAAKYLERVPPIARHRSIEVLNRFVPVTMYLKLNPDALAPAVVLLHGAGWSDAADLTLVMTEQRARNYWQLKPWITPDSSFDPTGEYPGAREEETTWKNAQAQYVAEPPATALRRALFRWCRAQLMVESPEDAIFPLDVAAATAKAMVDPRDPQQNVKRIDGLLAGQRLPITVADDAPLATRLQSWEARARMPRMVVSGGNAANGGPQIATGFVAPKPAYVPQMSDADALVALLADERPSRFSDFAGPRTLGDNAWRALATLLKADPRKLAGYPTDRPWTAAERKAAATAVAQWWKQHRAEYVKP